MPLLENLQTGMQVNGLRPNQLVTVISIQHHGSDTATITYRTPDGQLGEDLLTAEDISRLTVESASHDWTFDAPADSYLLALEAYRIDLAAMFDPRLAIHTSLVEPLPHQILAVYESMLPRTPLRFLLADDPGAGKTIMAGLYIRELMIRGDLQRCLIVTPGSLCDQWQEELHDKFRMNFEVATREKLMTAHSGNWFNEHNCVIARIDQLARYEFPPKKKPGDNENANDQLKGLLEDTSWDLVIVDEAHKMSAHYFGNEKKETKRFKLGKLLGPTTRNLLLMTATPHNGKEEDFQLFLSLVDPDRFEGKYDDQKHLQTNPADLMWASSTMTRSQDVSSRRPFSWSLAFSLSPGFFFGGNSYLASWSMRAMTQLCSLNQLPEWAVINFSRVATSKFMRNLSWEFLLPLVAQAARRHNQTPLKIATDHELADVEASHDGLAGARVVCKQEPKWRAREHGLVHGQDLVGQGLDQ